MIDPVTKWFEVIDIDRPDASSVMEAFNNTWLCRYPRPQDIGFDNGSEFKSVFEELCDNFGMTRRPSTEYNPQSHGVIETVHRMVGNTLRTFELENQELDEHYPWTPFLSATVWAIRSTYHTVLDATPGQVVFGRDMILPIQFKTDWASIQLRRKEQIQKDNDRINRSRLRHTYTVGQKVLLAKPGILRKMSTPREGPYEIVYVYTNGTVRIRRGPVTQRVNIRRITPYYECQLGRRMT